MDDTYEVVVDDSITELKTMTKSSNKDTSNTNTKKKARNKSQHMKQLKTNIRRRAITCVQCCPDNQDSPSICCNLCMEWFHPKCVGINNIDLVGAWVCASCRLLTKKVSLMSSQIEALLDCTMKISENVNDLTTKLENKFEKLNDRLTALSNQNQQSQSQQSSTDSISDINETMSNLRTELDRKSNTILSSLKLF